MDLRWHVRVKVHSSHSGSLLVCVLRVWTNGRMSPPLQDHIDYFCCPKIPLCSAYSCPSLHFLRVIYTPAGLFTHPSKCLCVVWHFFLIILIFLIILSIKYFRSLTCFLSLLSRSCSTRSTSFFQEILNIPVENYPCPCWCTFVSSCFVCLFHARSCPYRCFCRQDAS